MAASTMKKVDLGFVEKTAKWRLTSQFFPSKIGGKPAWLNLSDVPGVNTLSCGQCGKVMTFLLEVYSPPDEQDTCTSTEAEIESCFHRYVYIFCCRNPSCHQELKTPFTVLRCQLPRKNLYFSYEPPDDEKEILPEDVISPEQFGVNLCAVCGCNAGTTKCGRCHMTAYCSKDHQIQDWKSGHKTTCGKEQRTCISFTASNNKFLFPEYELVTEEENEEESDGVDEGGTENQERDSVSVSTEMQQEQPAESLISELKRNNFKEADLESMAKEETDDDRQFMAFKKRIASDPDQVLRYQKGGEPLYVSALQQAAEEDIPPCPCGAQRQFEFQVLPQLLRHLEVDSLEDSIDWGTLLIYTCTKNCLEGPAYHPEFLWKQNFQNSSI